MKYVVIILTFLISGFFSNYLYRKTDFIKFLIEKLRINTKVKCTIIDLIALFMLIEAAYIILPNYKNIVGIILLFAAATISAALSFIRIELKAYKK
ncbi:hypothetical protein IAI10_21765 [Clostridium sp. 19966]|uniref:hypothetical protein n=1 Tax=Clostridium sp. 19966 TaxID=2768166 RepID=UPI0028DF9384|nr:hypothetical protein [Clostridium sp. 19966]MDT8719285.1 hypothetical protein [Clostridium sp. 19966]